SSEGMARTTWQAMTSTTVPAIAPIGTSVNAETASPTAASAAMPAPTYPTASAVRSSPSVMETVVPDSSVTSPAGNSTSPVASDDSATTTVTAYAYTTAFTYFTASSRVRPAGAASR